MKTKLPNNNSELAGIISRLFNSVDGQALKDYLIEKYLDKPTWSPDKGDARGYYREGQNSVVRDLISLTKKVEND